MRIYQKRHHVWHNMLTFYSQVAKPFDHPSYMPWYCIIVSSLVHSTLQLCEAPYNLDNYWPYIALARLSKGKGNPYSISLPVSELIPVLGGQPAGDVSHKPGGRLHIPATLKRAAANFAAWWTEAQWVWTVCLRLLPDSVAGAIWTRALLRLSPAC